MFEILMFLFENYTDEHMALKVSQERLMDELEQIGFQRNAIEQALEWLDEFHKVQDAAFSNPILTSNALRHYAVEEQERLGLKGMSFLLYLEQTHILDAMTREIIIDRLMAFHDYGYTLNLDKIKWVTLLSLFNQPGKKWALSMLQNMILSDVFDTQH